MSEPTNPRQGLSRRDMIKASAAAGAAAWTAPVIIDSLSSPAAAVTHICSFYIFRMTDNGSSGTCSIVIDAGVCPTPTITGASTSCSSFQRQTSTTTPVNFSAFTCSGGTGNQTATFTINTAGRTFAGTAQSLGVTCASSVALNTASGTTVTLTQPSVPKNGSWLAYLAIA